MTAMEALMLDLLAAARDTLEGVERDTNYGIHNGDYVVPHGETRLSHMKDYDDCDCTLCRLRQFFGHAVSEQTVNR